VGLIPCSYCRKRPEEKLSQVTWAWNPRPTVRMAYRQRLCLQCFLTNVLPLDKPVEATGALTCPSCGIDTELDMEPVYCTAFLPGTGRLRLELPLCGPCAVEIRTRAQTNAELLPEREPESRGQAPSTPLVPSVWGSLGISPRE
jgi:hypothetical protein